MTLSREGVSQLYLMGRDGGNVRRMTQSSAIDTEPVFTPDGRSIYFVSDRGGSPQIYRMAAARRHRRAGDLRRQLQHQPGASAPTGKMLAYITRNGGRRFRLMTMDLAGGNIHALTDTNDDESPSFAPNGRLLIYATRAQGRDVLMTTTLDGKIKTRLLVVGPRRARAGVGPFRPLISSKEN